MTDWHLAVLEATDVAARVNRDITRFLRLTNLSKPAARIIVELKRCPNLADGELAEQIGMTGAQLSRNVGLLMSSGLVDSEPSPRHKRQRFLKLTEAGSAKAAEVTDARLRAMATVLPKLHPDDRAAITTHFHSNRQRKLADNQYSLTKATQPHALKAFSSIVTDVANAGNRHQFLAEASSNLALLYARWVDDHSGHVLVDQHDDVVGFYFVMPGSFEKTFPVNDTLTMFGPYVRPDLRGKGFAKKLLAKCLQEGARQYRYISTRASTRTPHLIKLLGAHDFQGAPASGELDRLDMKYTVRIYTHALADPVEDDAASS